MLARSKLAWEAPGAGLMQLHVAAYTTQASSSQSGRKPPQVERAIRIKSQMKRQSYRQEPRIYGEQHNEPQTSSRPFQHKGTPSRFQEKRTSQRYRLRQPVDSSDLRQPRLFGLDKGGERGSIRDLRYDVATKLHLLVKKGRHSPDAAFDEGHQLFESISGFERREVRIYNAMIRLAMQAGKRQWAIKAVSDMKKNGIAPSATTYRAIFEGLSMSKAPLTRDTVLQRSVHDLFQELETTWRRCVLAGKSRKKPAEEEEVDSPAETSTARSYKISKREMETFLAHHPAAFNMPCVYYMAFLLSIKAYDRAVDLLNNLDELTFSGMASEGRAMQSSSKLAFLVSSRYLFELTQHSMPLPEHIQQTIPKAIQSVLTALSEDKDLYVDPSLASSSTANVDLGTQRREIDRQIWVALSVLGKCQAPDKDKMIGDALQATYDSKRLASLPPITMEKTLRIAMDNVQGNPALVMRMFESALDYNDSIASRTDDKTLFADQVTVHAKDVLYCWNKAFIVASLEFKNLTKTMDLLQRAKLMRKAEKSRGGSSRFTPTSSPRPVVFSTLMRMCREKRDWNTAVQVWHMFFEDVEEQDRMQDGPSLQHLLCYFLTLACRLERDCKENDKVIRYSRLALGLIEKDFGLQNPALWERSETILKGKGAALKPLSEGQKQDPDVAFCVEYLVAIRATCRAALDTGEQGADLADKDQVEKWKELRKRAVQLRNLCDGSHFDEDEADWMRSGAKGKSHLALTDADMRELLD